MTGPTEEPRVYLVDDDEAIRDSLGWLFRSRGLQAVTYADGVGFLAALTSSSRGCCVIDIRMEPMNGLALFDQMLARGCSLPVIFLTGHGDVPTAVAALKKGAFDFVEKPFNDNALVDRVVAALAMDAASRHDVEVRADVSARLKALSPREQQVMQMILAGKMNKVIAADLDLSMRTVEVHRASIFAKMGVKSAVELAQLLAGNVQKQ